MNTNWRFRDHRGFQHDAVVVIGAGGAVGALAWALPLAGASWWIMMALGALVALLVGQGGAAAGARRHLVTTVTAALAALLAGRIDAGGKTVALVVSGGNAELAQVAEMVEKSNALAR